MKHIDFPTHLIYTVQTDKGTYKLRRRSRMEVKAELESQGLKVLSITDNWNPQ